MTAATVGAERVSIECWDRWRAVALMERLARHCSYLVQIAPQRWIVYARCDDAPLEELVDEIDAWRGEEKVGEIVVRGVERSIRLPRVLTDELKLRLEEAKR